MNYQALFSRILEAVDTEAYRTPADSVDPHLRTAMEEIAEWIHDTSVPPEVTSRRIHAAHESGRIDRVRLLSALHVLAASPRVKDYPEAARLAGEQELAALDAGGPNLEANLASVDRHRGVLAFLRGHYGVALDHFTRALERQRSSENISNVLAALLRLGELEEAEAILAQVRRTVSASLVRQLDHAISLDPDLAVLRGQEHP